MIYPRLVALSVSVITIIGLLTGCSTLTETKQTVTQDTMQKKIIASPNDKRSYRYIYLDNGLQAMLVSDPSSDKAAAAMDISVGSGDDPIGREGLAHFLEHMLFLGTEKYPQPGEYQAFINKHGGNHNAFTAFDHTNYFFDVDSDYLEPALDRFSEQFVSPLFSTEYVEREKNAVHSEYTSKLKDDGRRFFAVMKQAINPIHPMSKFSVGNLQTLADRDSQNEQDSSAEPRLLGRTPNTVQKPGKIRDDLLDFYQANYSAHIMRLVVYGKDSLDELEKLVRAKFSAVERRDVAKKQPLPDLFVAEEMPKLVKLKPIKDKRSLTLLFAVPPVKKLYHNKPAYYITNLIGHEGEGSLLSWLKSQELAESLSAGLFASEDDSAVLSISITLTRKGVDQYEDIIRDILSYIDLVKREGINKWRFKEQQKLLDTAFRFQEKNPPIHYVSSLANRLQDHAPEEVLAAPYVMDDYSPEILNQFLKPLTPENMVVFLNSPDNETDKIEPWYNVEYSNAKLSPEKIASLSKPNNRADLQLPKPNDFIPNDIELLDGETELKPQIVFEKPGQVGWYAKDNSFGTPRASFYLSIRTPPANENPKNLVLSELYVSLIQDQLSEFGYPAYLAGLDFKIYKHLRGITVRIDGYNDKQDVLLEKIIDTMTDVQLRQDRFDIFKEELGRELRNSLKNKPFERLASTARSWLLNPHWSEQEQLTALESVSIEDLRDFIPLLFSKLNVVTLAHGNMSPDEVSAANQLVEERITGRSEIIPVKKSNVINIQSGEWFGHINSDHQDTGYLLYNQGPSRTYLDRAAFGMIVQVMAPSYYHQIRTQQQMGYIVFATPYSILEVPGLAFIVQSPSFSASEINASTEKFITQFVEQLRSMPSEEFAKHQHALISRLTEKDKTLEQRTDRLWTEIDVGNNEFNTSVQIAKEVEQFDQNVLADYFEKHFIDNPQSVLLYSGPKSENWTPENKKKLDETGWLEMNKVFKQKHRD